MGNSCAKAQQFPKTAELGGCVDCNDGIPKGPNGETLTTRGEYLSVWADKLAKEFPDNFQYLYRKGKKLPWDVCSVKGLAARILPIAGALALPILGGFVLPEFTGRTIVLAAGGAAGYFYTSALTGGASKDTWYAALIVSTAGPAGAVLLVDSTIDLPIPAPIAAAAAAGVGYYLLMPIVLPVLEYTGFIGKWGLSIIDDIQGFITGTACEIDYGLGGGPDLCKGHTGDPWLIAEVAAGYAMTARNKTDAERRQLFRCILPIMAKKGNDQKYLVNMGQAGYGCRMYTQQHTNPWYTCGDLQNATEWDFGYEASVCDKGTTAPANLQYPLTGLQYPLTGLKMACGPIMTSVKNTKAAPGGNTSLAIANMGKRAAARTDTACDPYQKQWLQGLANTLAVDPATNRVKSTCATGFTHLAANAVERTNQFRAMGWLLKRDGTFQDTCATQSQVSVIKTACPTSNCSVFRGI